MAYIFTEGLIKSKAVPAAYLELGGVFEGMDSCPNCGRPPILLGVLRAGLVPDLSDSVDIPLFFCWTCEGAYEPQTYRRREDGTWEVVFIASRPMIPDFPFKNYPQQFPQTRVPLFDQNDRAVGLVLDSEEEWCLEFCHRVGGEGRMLHEGPYPPEGFRFLATLSSVPELGLDDVDNCGVLTHFFGKPDPLTLWAFQEWD